MFFELFRQAGIVALLSLVITVLPLAAGIVYAIWPTEARLARMRPISLAGIFAALCGFLSGLVNILRYVGVNRDAPIPVHLVALGLSEALVPLLLGFGCLTVAWLCVALGLRRHP